MTRAALVMLGLALACAAPAQGGGGEEMGVPKQPPVGPEVQPAAPELGVPEGAIFYWGEVSRAHEPQANRRWALLADGTLLHSSNGADVDLARAPREPFQRPWKARDVRAPEAAIRAFFGALAPLQLPTLGSPVRTPEGLVVQGGVTTWVFLNPGGAPHLLAFEPEAPGLDAIWQAWRALLASAR